ncbi:MAG: NADPH:quinone oxidoreductase family protein [Burkholderiales bacterium]|nr:NADPH:quinone oxidoreductase family protein [Burkholderiales bacterium]
MKAVLCKQYGPPDALVVEEVPSPQAGKGQVVVSVKAAGVNFPDTLIIQGKYQFKPEPPFSPGGEVAGLVKETGEGVTGVRAGDRVIASSTWGGFAEEMVVDAERLVPMPEDMDYVPASAFILTYGTSYHALKDRAQLSAGETLLVLGASGGVGLAAIQLGKAMGARVIAAASSAAKLQVCRANGADETIDYSSEDLRARIKAITQGRGVDVIYDPVGGPYSEPALRDMAWNGRYLVVGFAAGDIPRIPLNLALLKGCSIVGVFWGAFTRNEPERNRRNNEDLMQLYQQGRIRPHVHATYPLERAAEALNEVLYKRVSGKVVLTV